MYSQPSPFDLNRVRRLAIAVRALCLMGLVIIGALPIIFWAQPDWVAEVVYKEWGMTRVQLGFEARIGGLLGSLLPGGTVLFSLWQMWSLFGCFARGELLAPEPAKHLRRLGLALSFLAIAQPLGRTLSMLAITWGNPAGERQLWFGLSSDNYLSLLFGLLLLALAQVLGEAARVNDENAAFI